RPKLRRSVRLVASVAWPLATVVAKPRPLIREPPTGPPTKPKPPPRPAKPLALTPTCPPKSPPLRPPPPPGPASAASVIGRIVRSKIAAVGDASDQASLGGGGCR